VAGNVTFSPVINWNSELGFSLCDNESFYNNRKPCHSFEFRTRDNSFPLDSPSSHLQVMSSPLRFLLKFFSILGLIGTLMVIIITYLYRRRRVVKMSQPLLSNFSRIGLILGFIRVLCASLETNPIMCEVRLWFEHVAFQLIFTSLLVRCWRVYLVTSSMKRIKVSDHKCILLILSSMLLIFLLLLIITLDNNISEKHVTIIQNQFEYIIQSSCDYPTRNLITVMYSYDALILLVGLYYCWLIRKVQSTVSNTSVLVEVLVTTSLVSILMFVVMSSSVSILSIEPIQQQFIVSLVISLLLLRLLWLLDCQLICNLLLGYDLDRALILRKTEFTIFELGVGLFIKKKVFITNENGSTSCTLPTLSAGGATAGAGGRPLANQEEMDFMAKGLEKYAKMKNCEELSGEISRVKEEIRLRQMELVCLENMIFASERDSSSKKSGGSGIGNGSSHLRRGSQHSGAGGAGGGGRYQSHGERGEESSVHPLPSPCPLPSPVEGHGHSHVADPLTDCP
jgi:hypothetical protein